MLLSKTVKINPKYRRKYYENLGYDIPLEDKQLYFRGVKNGIKKIVPKDTEIEIDIVDLPKKSGCKVDVKCDNCGKEYSLKYNNYFYQTEKHNGKLYCCDCANKVCNSGENNISWNPDLTEEERIIKNKLFRHIDGYKDFIKKVMYIYNYKCVLCKDDKNIVVHHLDGYEWCNEKRTDINNGICLCEKCHKNFHSKYGYKGNTKEQFEEWTGMKIEKIPKNFIINIESSKKVICLETKEIYDSSYECELILFKKRRKGLGSGIKNCCDRKGTCKNLHFIWYNDYLKMNEDEINSILNKNKFSQPKSHKKVICLENKQIFSSITNATKYFNKKQTSNLSSHIKGKKKTFAGYHWCYAEDYNGNIEELEKVGDGW